MKEEEIEVLRLLLEIRAIELKAREEEWFTWSSGLKSPIYCDNRLVISYPKIRQKVTSYLVNLIKTNYPDVEYIAGTSTAGIPHAAWISERLNLPLIYVRSEAKKHGRKNQIEGRIESGKKVVIVEDLVSTAASLINVARAVKEAGFQLLGSVAIFSYKLLKSESALRKEGLKLNTLTNYNFLITLLVENEVINNSEATKLLAWRDAQQ